MIGARRLGIIRERTSIAPLVRTAGRYAGSRSDSMNRIVWLALFVALVFGVAQMFVFMHEYTHSAVFKIYGVSSTMRIGLLYGDTTSEVIKLPADERLQLEHDQSMIEVVGYHMFMVVIAILLGCFMVSVSVLSSKDDIQHRYHYDEDEEIRN